MPLPGHTFCFDEKHEKTSVFHQPLLVSPACSGPVLLPWKSPLLKGRHQQLWDTMVSVVPVGLLRNSIEESLKTLTRLLVYLPTLSDGAETWTIYNKHINILKFYHHRRLQKVG